MNMKLARFDVECAIAKVNCVKKKISQPKTLEESKYIKVLLVNKSF